MEKLAQSIENPILGSLSGMSGTDFIQGLLRSLINLGLIIGVVIFFFMFLLGGIQWISSGGDKVAAEAARGRLTSAVLGLIILFAIFAIMGLVESVFGFDILILDFGALSI